MLQDTLLNAVQDAVATLLAGSADLLPVLVVGAPPLRHGNRVYNTALVIHRGTLLGVVPKSYLPTYREFYERRQIAAGDDARGTIRINGADVPFGPDLLFTAADLPDFVLHVEICEDMWYPFRRAPRPRWQEPRCWRTCRAAPITIGRAEDRKLLARSASSRCLAAYVYAAAGEGESTTDLAWDADHDLRERGAAGRIRSLPERGAAQRRRRRHRTAARGATAQAPSTTMRAITAPQRTCAGSSSPSTHRTATSVCAERWSGSPPSCRRIRNGCSRIATRPTTSRCRGLEQRLRALNYPKVVIGVSGGLDSTHALIVAAKAMDRESRPRSDILAFTLPGFATGDRTKGNAIALSKALGVTFEEIDIRDTATLMLTEMGHPVVQGEKVYDITFENVQAGLRTDYLFRLANQRGGIVLGTGGDLSELGLGWSTYGVGDQMSHYNVNGGVPKTLIQHLIRWVISSGQFGEDVNEVLASVLDTEITPGAGARG